MEFIDNNHDLRKHVSSQKQYLDLRLIHCKRRVLSSNKLKITGGSFGSRKKIEIDLDRSYLIEWFGGI